MGPRMREDTGSGAGLSPAFAGAGFRREDNGTGRVCVGGGGRDPRMREDTGRGVVGFCVCCLLLWVFLAGAGK